MALILVGFDGSPPARRALDHAASRAGPGDEILVVWAMDDNVRNRSFSSMMPAGVELPPEMGGTFEQRAKERLEEAIAEHAKRGAKIRGELRAGRPAPAVLGLADETRAALIVIGHKAYEGRHLTLGRNADEILRGAKVPVTVVP